jgi:hypothetical protein
MVNNKCDGHSSTLTILKAKESEFIFGGFATVSWESSTDGKWKSDPNAFIFSLNNGDKWPLKMKVKTNRHKNAFYCNSRWAPTVGNDISSAENDNNPTMDSYSNLGYAFKQPQRNIK